MEAVLSLPLLHSPTSSLPHCPKDSPLPVIQRLRVGVEFARCIRDSLGGFRLQLSTTVRVLSSSLLLIRHPLSLTAASQQFHVPSCHSSLPSSPTYTHHEIISPSLPPKISPVPRAPPQLLTLHLNSPRNSAVDELVLPHISEQCMGSVKSEW